jgi:hypothetical protein
MTAVRLFKPTFTVIHQESSYVFGMIKYAHIRVKKQKDESRNT